MLYWFNESKELTAEDWETIKETLKNVRLRPGYIATELHIDKYAQSENHNG